MKKLLVCLLALTFVMSMSAVAQDKMDKMGGDMKSDKAAAAPLKSLKGTVKADGEKMTFVNDADQKSWNVQNPEALKGHDGHHVKVKAHVYEDKGEIHVMSVKMVKEGDMSKTDKKGGEMK